jgi:hypothetical protein
LNYVSIPSLDDALKELEEITKRFRFHVLFIARYQLA